MSDASTRAAVRKAAGASDVVLVVVGFVGFVGFVGTSEADLAKTGGVNADLWTGIAMLAVAVAFVLWARLRPIIVELPSITPGR
jgi:hypothetical protein